MIDLALTVRGNARQASSDLPVDVLDRPRDASAGVRAGVVGVGATEYYKRGQSFPETELSMACTAILAALADAGLTIADLDGFSIYSSSCDPATVGAELGVKEVRWATTTTSGGGGCVGALGVAAAAIDAGMATTVVSLMTLQQLNKRLGGSAIGGVLGYATASEGSSP